MKATALASLSLMLFCAPATYAAVLDQVYEDEAGAFNIGDVAAQTFTVGITGQLSRIDLRLGVTAGIDHNFIAYVRSVQDGNITGPNLGALTVPRSSLPFPIQPNTYINLDFLSQDIHVNAGEQFAIIVEFGDTPGIEWGLGATVKDSQGLPIGGYSGGHAMVESSSGFVMLPTNPSRPDVIGLDFNFRTFVQPIPEPSTLVLCCVLGLSGICLRLRRAKHPVRKKWPNNPPQLTRQLTMR